MHDPAPVASTTTALRAARRAAGLSQAARAGISGSWLGALDSGAAPLRSRMGQRLADALGIAVALLLPDPIEHALAAPGMFHCDAMGCLLSVRACLDRQRKNARRAWKTARAAGPRDGSAGGVHGSPAATVACKDAGCAREPCLFRTHAVPRP